MVAESEKNAQIEQMLSSPDLAGALESEQFKQFLDQVPIAIAVSTLQGAENIIYNNVEFEQLTGQVTADVKGKSWDILRGLACGFEHKRLLSEAITGDQDYIGKFTFEGGSTETVDVWSNVIADDDGKPSFRLIALVDGGRTSGIDPAELERRIHDKDLLLRELQHRVSNNLQMVTALIRIEARNVPDDVTNERFDRLAGRIESLALLYRSLSDEGKNETIDLGVYLSEIASAVMRAHAVEGIHLDLQIDTWPVSINVAMPAGLVVNELLTNALKHAFKGRDGGTITLHSLVDAQGCRVLIADDGIGMKEGAQWPQVGKLSAVIVDSLRQNARAQVNVESEPGEGMKVSIFFSRAAAQPADVETGPN